MCRGLSEGGRRCPSCTPGNPKYDAARELANKNRRTSRAQRRAVAGAVGVAFGDGDAAKRAASAVMASQPRNIPAMLAYMETLDAATARAARDAALEVGDGRHLPGVHNQNTLNDRVAEMTGDRYAAPVGHLLRPDPKAVDRVMHVNSLVTQAYLDSDRSSTLPKKMHESLREAAVNAEFVSENIGLDGSYDHSAIIRTNDQNTYTMRNLTPEDALNLSFTEEAMAAAARKSFLNNSRVKAQLRPVVHKDDMDGFKATSQSSVKDAVEFMQTKGIGRMKVRDGVDLVVNEDYEQTGEPPYTFEVDGGDVSLPAAEDSSLLKSTARIPLITGFESESGEDASKDADALDDQHMTLERLTSSSTVEGTAFRKQLSREIMTQAFMSGKDVGRDKRWVTDPEGGVSAPLVLEEKAVAGKRRSVTASTLANVGLKQVAQRGKFMVQNDQLPSTSRNAIAASLNVERDTMGAVLKDKVGYVEGVRTVHGDRVPAIDNRRVRKYQKATLMSDRSSEGHTRAMEGIEKVVKKNPWSMEDKFDASSSPAAAKVLRGRVMSDQDIERMVRNANAFEDAQRDTKRGKLSYVPTQSFTKSDGGDALLMERALTQQQAENLYADARGEGKPQTVVSVLPMPVDASVTNSFSTGRVFVPDEHLLTSVDGTPDETGTSENQVRLVFNTTQNVALSSTRGAFPRGSRCRVARRMRDEDGVLTVFLVDESECLAEGRE